MTAYSEQPAAEAVDDVGLASSEMRRRRRERTEPESEPEALSGLSDSDCECPLAPQLKRLRLSETDPLVDAAAEEWRGGQDCCMAVDGTTSTVVHTLTRGTPPMYYSEHISQMDDGNFKFEDPPVDLGGSVHMREDRELEKTKCARHTHSSLVPSPADLPLYPQHEATASGGNGSGINRPTQAALRAEIQRRAFEEMQRYRQSLRNYEGGLSVRPCDGF